MDGVGATIDVKSGAEGESGFGETGMIRGIVGPWETMVYIYTYLLDLVRSHLIGSQGIRVVTSI